MGNCSGCIDMRVQSHVNFEEEGIVFTKSSKRGNRINKAKMDDSLEADLISGTNINKIILIQRTFRKLLIQNKCLTAEKNKNYFTENKSFEIFNYYSTNKAENSTPSDNHIDNWQRMNNLLKKDFTYIKYQSNTYKFDESLNKEYQSKSIIEYDPIIGSRGNNKISNEAEGEENIEEEIEAYSSKLDNVKKIVISNGSTYIGHSVDNKADGFGILIHADEDVYCGFWKADEAHGIGKYTNLKGSNYQGLWMDNKRNGYGIEIWPTGSCYEGYFLDGHKNSVGIQKFDDGTCYEGEFSNNYMSGVGIFYFKDSRIYYGEWKNNKMNGYGIITWSDGKRYEGSFLDDKKEGFGIFYDTSKIYVANWKNSKLDEHVLIIQNRTITKSFWKMGKKITTFPEDYYHPYDIIAEEILN